MPRGLKRKFEDRDAPAVGVKNQSKKSTKMVDKEAVAITRSSKQNNGNGLRRVSKRVVKAKRKLDFIYEKDQNKANETQTTFSVNNNAQVAKRNLKSKTNGRSTHLGVKF